MFRSHIEMLSFINYYHSIHYVPTARASWKTKKLPRLQTIPQKSCCTSYPLDIFRAKAATAVNRWPRSIAVLGARRRRWQIGRISDLGSATISSGDGSDIANSQDKWGAISGGGGMMELITRNTSISHRGFSPPVSVSADTNTQINFLTRPPSVTNTM